MRVTLDEMRRLHDLAGRPFDTPTDRARWLETEEGRAWQAVQPKPEEKPSFLERLKQASQARPSSPESA